VTLSVPAAYLPVVDSPWSQAPSRKVKQHKEEIFHKSLFLLFPQEFLQAQYDGITVQQWGGVKHHGVPIVGLWVGDHPEQNLLALVGGSNCAFCKDGMDKWHDLCGKISIRKVASMQASFQEAEQHYRASRFSEMIKCLQKAGHTCNSLVSDPYPPVPNTLWMLRFFRYGILSPEEMHDFSGLFMYVMTAWKKCITTAYKSEFKEGPAYFIDQSYIKMPLFTGVPRFTKGILHLKTFTAARYRVLMKTLVCVMADVFPDNDHSWINLTVSFLEYFTIAKQKSFVVDDLNKMLVLMREFSDLAHTTLLMWSPSQLNFPKFHVLKHHVWFIYFFGCFSNYSANVLEALHKLLCKDPWRNSSGIGACLCSPHCFVLSSDSFCNIGQDQQVINYVTRHQTMQDHKQFIALLFPDSQKDDQPQDDEMGAAELANDCEPELIGARRFTKTIDGYTKIHTAGTAFYTPAFKQFERCLRLYLFLLEHDGEGAPEGPRSDLRWLPEQGKHQVVTRPTLKFPKNGHPYVKHSPTVKALTPALHGSSEERLDNVMILATDEGGEDVEYVGQLLLLITFIYQEVKYDAAFVWWYNVLSADHTTCKLVDRCYHQIPGLGRVPHCEVRDLSDVKHRVHLIPRSQSGSWERSKFHFRLNRFILTVP
jgi:hypothetical protein